MKNTFWIIIAVALVLGGDAIAQSSPGLFTGEVPNFEQWNGFFTVKADVDHGVLNNPTINNPIFNGVIAFPGGITPNTTMLNGPGNLSVLSNVPLDGVYSTGGGALVSMCPGYNFGCNTAINAIMAQSAEVTTSAGDAAVQESSHYAYMVNGTGQALPWATSTSYSAGQVSVAASGANLYKETVGSCTSASSGSGPTGTGIGISDGTCSWTFEGSAGLRGKFAFAATTLVNPGGTQAWAGVFDTFIEPGWLDGFATGAEVDVTNNSGRDATGSGLSIYDLYLGGSVGTEPITAYLNISPFALSGSNFMAHEGIWIQGQFTTAGHDLRVSTHSLTAIFDDGSSVHGTSSYYDASTSPSSYIAAGTYSGAALNTNAATTSIALEAGSGQKICLNGTDACFFHSGSKLFYEVGGVNMFSVADSTGNVIFKGTVTPSSTP